MILNRFACCKDFGVQIGVPALLQLVANPELVQEMSIQRASGLFELTEGSAPLTIQLKPMRSVYVDGNPKDMILFFSLGLVPAEVPNVYVFEFELHQNCILKQYAYELMIRRRTSFWELFRSSPESEEALAADLRHAFLTARPTQEP